MLQTVITYSVVVAAAIWVGWRILLPRGVRRRLSPTASGQQKCDKNCGCSS